MAANGTAESSAEPAGLSQSSTANRTLTFSD